MDGDNENHAKPAKYDLEERLINFGSRVIDVVEALPGTVAGKHLGGHWFARVLRLH